MNADPRSLLLQEYSSALREYVAGARETGLLRAYDLGRRAVAEGLGVLDMADIQNEVLASLLRAPVDGTPRADLAHSAGRFFLESLSPYEMTHRGFRDANEALRRLNELLEDQARQIAHALHDDAGQLLVGVHLALEEIARDLDPSARDRLRKTRELLDHVEERLRHFSHELRPTMLDDLGLLPALQFLARRVSQRTGVAVRVKFRLEGRFPPPVETALYRIFQEGINNVVRHSRAREVTAELRRDGGALRYSIRDDGVGFDPQAGAGTQASLGLKGIRERVTALGGALEIRSAPGRGTELVITIPSEPPDAASDPAR